MIVVVIVLIYVVLDLLEFQKFVIADAILLSLLGTISLYIVSMGFKNESSFRKVNETLDKTKNDSDQFKKNFNEIHDAYLAQGLANTWMTDSIKDVVTTVKDIKKQVDDIQKESNATVRELDSQPEFYSILDEKVLAAKYKVWLMHLDPHAPDSKKYYNDPARENYFAHCAAKAIAQNGVKNPVEFRRIINIPTLDKLEWAEKLINETKDIQNLHLAYIHLDDIENSFPISVTSCQIMDNKAVFLLNPELNVVPPGKFKKCIIIENEKVVSIYEKYYERIWELLEKKDSNLGCIIKDGPGIELFYKNQQRILDNIKQDLPQSNEGDIKG
jgi:hypothetical protein